MSDKSRSGYDDHLRHQLAETVEFDDAQQWPLIGDDRVEGRREMESESSDYQPSDSESSPEPAVPEIKEEEGDSVRLGEIEARAGSSSGSKDENTTSRYKASLKRSRERTFSTPLVDNDEPQSKKRQRPKSPVNMHYVELLDDDMDDARRKYVPENQPELLTTQIGLTVWTTEEKEMFYESVARLGRDDIQGIAARLLGSKSEIEVRHYMHVLKENAEIRKRDLRAPLHRPLLSDFPAATEISEACCTALQKAADAVVRREDHQEAKEEQRKWGPHWLLTGDNCRDLTKAALEMTGMPTDDQASNQSAMPGGGPQGERLAELGAQMRPGSIPMLALFNVQNMLLLSERVFMNGVDEDANYMGLGGALPAVHMSALHDLYALVYALTQRLAATAMHVCQSRDQAKRHLPHSVKKLVRPQDVRAAVASLGLKRNSHVFWARCPRRLGLIVSRSAVPFADMDGTSIRPGVVDNDSSEDDSAEDEAEESASEDDGSEEDSSESENSNSDDEDSDIVSTYDEVEKELLPESADHATNQQPSSHDVDENEDWSSSDEDVDDSDDDDESDGNSSDDSDDSDNSDDSQDNNEQNKEPDADAIVTEQRIKDEADEIIHYTANGYPTATWAQASLKNRIRDELKEEEYAGAVDAHASRRDEQYLWTVLGQRPPPELGLYRFDENATPHVEGFSTNARRFPVDEIIETGSNWRDRLQYETEWEDAAVQAQKTAREANKQAKELP